MVRRCAHASARLRRGEAPRRHLFRMADPLRQSRALLHAGRAPVPRASSSREAPTELKAGAPYKHSTLTHKPCIQKEKGDCASPTYIVFGGECWLGRPPVLSRSLSDVRGCESLPRQVEACLPAGGVAQILVPFCGSMGFLRSHSFVPPLMVGYWSIWHPEP